MKWNIDISRIQGAYLEQAKVEALRAIAEQLEKMNVNGLAILIQEDEE